MKKRLRSIILVLLVIFPIVALALPSPAYCPAVTKTGHHDLTYGTGGKPSVYSYNSSTHSYTQVCPEKCLQCTYEAKPTHKYTQSHAKGQELDTYYEYSLKNSTHHYRKLIQPYWCNYRTYGCKATIKTVKSTTTQKHSCARHQKYGDKLLHICSCGEVKTAAPGSHW